MRKISYPIWATKLFPSEKHNYCNGFFLCQWFSSTKIVFISQSFYVNEVLSSIEFSCQWSYVCQWSFVFMSDDFYLYFHQLFLLFHVS